MTSIVFVESTLASSVVVFVVLLGMGVCLLWLLSLPLRAAFFGWRWGVGRLFQGRGAGGVAARRVPLAAEVRARVIANANFRCEECGATEDLTVDHKLAVIHGGTNEMSNLRCLCRPCNSRKGVRW